MEIKVIRDNGEVKARASGDRQAILAWTGEYAKGDAIVLEGLEENCFYWWKADDTIEEALVYVTDSRVIWPIPVYEKKANRSPLSFLGTRHYLCIRRAEKEAGEYRNVVLNPADEHDLKGVYPHASANVETRGESVFAAQNAIDGYRASCSHGEWPYQSWGINRRADAALTIELGAPARIDRIDVYLRADFPHDSWWEEIPVTFSDGSEEILRTQKPTGEGQSFPIAGRTISWLRLHDLKKHEDESPFPALTQIEVYGITQRNL